ncbi:MAG: exonuclease SbcCD subunit D [Candidatus Methylomirabilia bacterium]
MPANKFKVIHTADWHLGRTLLQVSLLEQQRQIIENGFLPLVREARPDLVVIAGDIYDRAVPPPDAVRLLDDTLTELTLGIGVPVLAISGNHDSEGRVSYASRILSRSGLNIHGGLQGRLEPLLYECQKVAVVPLPFFEPVEAAAWLGVPGPLTAAESMRLVLERLVGQVPAGWRKVLVGHAFVQGGSVSDSERPLPGAGAEVGGAGLVPAGVFAGWDLVLLGHLHRPQRVGASAVHYAGSLLKYSFSEADHVKGVTLHTLDGGGATAEQFALAPARDLRIVRVAEGERLEDVAARDTRREDYVRIEYHGQPIPMERLRELYPNVLEPWRIVEAAAVAGTVATVRNVREQGLEELFLHFLEYVRGGKSPVSDAHRRALHQAMADLDAAAREAR